MAQVKKDNRIVIKGDDVRHKLLEGAKAVFDSVTTTYGPRGRNALIEKGFGRPVPTRDGVTVARDTYFSDRAKNMGAQLILEASETTNKIAGDGTTATVAYAYNLLKYGVQQIAAGTHPMELKDILTNDSKIILKRLDELKTEVGEDQLTEVATVSAGDKVLGKLIAGAIQKVGIDGGILTERSQVLDIERKFVDGYYMRMGFQALQSGKKELIDPFVIVSHKPLTTAADAFELLTRTAQLNDMQPGQIPRVLFIGNFEAACYNLIVENINRNAIDSIVIKTPPEFGEMGKELLADIAIYAGCQMIGEADSMRTFGKHNIGRVNRIVATHKDSTLFAPNDTEAVKDRVKDIKERVEKETVDNIAEKLKNRIAMLEGKVATFEIGGATDSEKEEKEFRVDDAIQATRSAYKYGVVAGAGVTLMELSRLDISKVSKQALEACVKKLLSNANFNVGIKIHEMQNAKYPMGYNIRQSDKLVNVIDSGVLDPKQVVEEVIKNATSVACTALTTDVLLIFEDLKEE